LHLSRCDICSWTGGQQGHPVFITNTSWFAILQCSCVQGSSHWQHGQ
jgi:hypothetical protein